MDQRTTRLRPLPVSAARTSLPERGRKGTPLLPDPQQKRSDYRGHVRIRKTRNSGIRPAGLDPGGRRLCRSRAGLRPRPATKPRIQEIIEFARKMNYRRLGFAFCMGLRKEATVVEKLLTGAGFEVVSTLCKVGRTPKENIGVRDEQKIRIGSFESMCNPIAQAYLVNDAKTDFNVMLGLCVGHDSLF